MDEMSTSDKRNGLTFIDMYILETDRYSSYLMAFPILHTFVRNISGHGKSSSSLLMSHFRYTFGSIPWTCTASSQIHLLIHGANASRYSLV